jgi:hypothetical protein
VVGGRVYSVADSLKLVPKHSRAYDLSQPAVVKTAATSSDSERRKKTALRDLEKRMETAVAVSPPAPVPDAKIDVPAPAAEVDEQGYSSTASFASDTD